MRILIIGFVVFVLWSVFSVWLYVDKIKPALNKPETVQEIPETQTNIADTLMQQPATTVRPNDLIIYFEFDNAEFKPDPETDGIIAEFRTWLDNNPETMLYITGHTDIIGTREYNNILGLRRAQNIKEYLESKSIEAGKMITESKGEDDPATDQNTEEGRAMNRRSVLTIKK